MRDHGHSFFGRQLSGILAGLRRGAKWACLLPKWRRVICFLLALALLALALPGRPLNTLRVQRTQGPGPQFLLPLGRTFTTVYEHSVERTPVEDIYHVSADRLYPWRTRTRSHNAGLPVAPPEHGRFLTEKSWLVLEGGHPALESVRLRVGDALLGRNELIIDGAGRLELFTLFPGERVLLVPERRPLLAPIVSDAR